jgi:hypothetical protein
LSGSEGSASRESWASLLVLEVRAVEDVLSGKAFLRGVFRLGKGGRVHGGSGVIGLGQDLPTQAER